VLPLGPAGLPPVSAAPPPLAASLTEEEAAIAAYLATRRTGLSRLELDSLARTIVGEARRQHLDAELVMAVMHVESRYNSYAVSPVGALGLMQILPKTGQELAAREGIAWHGPQMLFDPIVNVRLGVAYLRELSNRYGELSTALAAYNWGPGRIDRRLRRGRTLPTEYPRLVFEAHAKAQRQHRS
jgi:soluble lytic murein transglycosylase